MDWIKLSERTPFVGDKVISWNGKERRISTYTCPIKGSGLYETDRYKKWFQYTDNDTLFEHHNVTHWMPLPDPPSE